MGKTWRNDSEWERKGGNRKNLRKVLKNKERERERRREQKYSEAA